MNQGPSKNNPASFFIPQQAVSFETEVKRSRFIAQIAHVEDKAAADSFIQLVKTQYPDARHHCWAYIACPPNSASAVRFSDAGEPQGTAGRPILNILQHSGMGEIICVVSRYFGGIKLGAGGLVRAYSNSAKTALDILSSTEKIPFFKLQLQFDYHIEADLRYSLTLHSGEIINIGYQQQIDILVKVPEASRDQFMQQLEALQIRKKTKINIRAC